MFAVFTSNGNQYKVEVGKEYKIDLLEETTEKKITFSDVLLISGDKVIVGDPVIKGASVSAEIVSDDFLDKKVMVYKFHAKKRYKKTQGHRQHYTIVKVLKINTPNEK